MVMVKSMQCNTKRKTVMLHRRTKVKEKERRRHTKSFCVCARVSNACHPFVHLCIMFNTGLASGEGFFPSYQGLRRFLACSSNPYRRIVHPKTIHSRTTDGTHTHTIHAQ